MFNISQPPSFTPQIMRLLGQLLIGFADSIDHAPQGMPMPGMPGSGADGFPANPFANGSVPQPPFPEMPPGVMDMLRNLGVPIPDGFGTPGSDDGEGLYGQEDTEEGGAYVPTPDGDHPFVDEDTIVPRAFDPHDLDLAKYEDCSEKQRQEEDPERRDKFRKDPVLWMETACYYAHQMVDAKCDVEEAARSFLVLPGGPVRRIQAATNAKVHKEYDAGWQEAQNLIQTAYDADRLDATDFQAVMVLLGDPCSWNTQPLKAQVD